VKTRMERMYLMGSTPLVHVNTGDIIALVFWKDAIIYRFDGICIAVKKFSLLNLETSICVRNVILGIGIEVVGSYFINQIYSLIILDYKRKQFLYRKSKLYYLRCKLNRASRVK
jgi:ribosomal protein L19